MFIVKSLKDLLAAQRRIMSIPISVTVLLVFTLNSVSCQESVEGFVGEDVVLPCIHDQSLQEPFNIFWRDKDDDVVLNIKKSLEDPVSQGQKYRDRVSSFPDEYKNRNFSIIMKNLQKDDSDTYECNTLSPDDLRTVRLTVSEKPPVKPTGTSPPGSGAAGLNLHQVALLSAVCLLLCF